MLYLPWRAEQSEIIDKNKRELYYKNFAIIEKNRIEFDPDQNEELM